MIRWFRNKILQIQPSLMQKNFLLLAVMLFLGQALWSQDKDIRIILITTDGFRWQEFFRGMDPLLASNKKYNQGDSAYLFEQYGGATAAERRLRLLPFVWGQLVQQGQIFGDRDQGAAAAVANPYKFSYPGYNELLTGWVDAAINTNIHPPNPHQSFLAVLQQHPQYRNQVAAFGAWDAFPRILNEQANGFPVVSAFADRRDLLPKDPQWQVLQNMLQASFKPWKKEECLDLFTHYQALHYLKTKRPKALYIAYGETDEFAHAGQYRYYLDAAHQFDAWVKEIWDWVEKDNAYKGKTILMITTDHGRGDWSTGGANHWTDHGAEVVGAEAIWMGVLGAGIPAKGNQVGGPKIFQRSFAPTLMQWAGIPYLPNHPVSAPLQLGNNLR